jgi:hypothetical protein
VRHPRGGYQSPGFLIGPDKDVILWGFTGGIIARLFDFLGWTRPWDESRVRDLPAYMLQADTGRSRRGGDLLDIEDDPDDPDERDALDAQDDPDERDARGEHPKETGR